MHETQLNISHEGRNLHAVVEGEPEGPPVVFLHGLSVSGENFAWLPEEIMSGRRIVRPDLRGHGSSDPAPRTYLLERYSSDVVAILERVVEERAVLVGHSLGGCVAWWLAQNRPDLIAAALLEDPPLYMAEPAEHEANPHLEWFEPIRDTAIRWQREGATPAAVRAELAAELAEPPGAPPEKSELTMGDVLARDCLESMGRALLEMDPEVMTAAANRSTLADTDLLSPISVPVLVVAAGVVPGFTENHERRLATTHPEIDVVRVAGAGHMIHDEIASRPIFTSILSQFLAQHAPVDRGRTSTAEPG